jgi:outer membrane immunogenic protein
MMKRIILAALMAGVASSALAADLPTRKAPSAPAPSYYQQPSFTWTGFYLGINGGFGYGTTSNTNFANQTGGLIGATGGYNLQMGQFVVGVEGDVDWADMKRGNSFASPLGAGGASTNYQIDTMVTARGRVGYAIDRTLLFITGGYAGMETRANLSDPNFGSMSQDRWRSGGVIGGGIEYAFTNNISAKAEYLWAPLQDKTYWAGTPDQETNRMSMSIARVGLNYKF